MVRVCRVLLLAAIVSFVGVAPPVTADAPPTTIKLGVLSGMFRDVPPDLVQVVATPFRDLFQKQTGVESEVEMVGDCDALADRLMEKKVHFGVFHGFEWAWVRGRYPELHALVVTIPPKKVQACIVVHANSKAEKPADLNGVCLTLPVAAKAHTILYIDRLMQTLPMGCCRPVPHTEWGSDSVLDAVADGKTPAALLDAATVLGYANNKPGKAKQIKVLCQSDPFPPTVIVFRKGGVDPSIVEKVRSGLVQAKDNAHGRAFLFLWKLKGFEDVSAVYEADLQKIFKAYPPPPPGMGPAPK